VTWTATAAGPTLTELAGAGFPPMRGAAWWGSGYVGWVYTPTTVAWVSPGASRRNGWKSPG